LSGIPKNNEVLQEQECKNLTCTHVTHNAAIISKLPLPPQHVHFGQFGLKSHESDMIDNVLTTPQDEIGQSRQK
jgi:hypothetical protein